MNMMRHSRIRIILLLLLIPAARLSSQSTFIQRISFPFPGPEPVFQAACQDSSGYILLGSSSGLFRFDGIELKPLKPAENRFNIDVTSLFAAPGGTTWVGCRDGRIYTVKDHRMSLFQPGVDTISQAISGFAMDPQGNIYWSTRGDGVYFLSDGSAGRISRKEGLADDFVHTLSQTPEGHIIACTDAGVSFIRFEDGGIKAVSPALNKSLPDLITYAAACDDAGTLWLGFHDGGFCLVRGDSVIYRPAGWPYGPVSGILALPGAGWISTLDGHILWFAANAPGRAPRQVIFQGQPEFGKINDILQDREGNAWLLSSTGLWRSASTRLSAFTSGDSPVFKNINALFPDRFNRELLWFANDEGLFRLDLHQGLPERVTARPQLPPMRFTSLYQDDRGMLWAGTFNHGVVRIDTPGGSWRQITEAGGLVNNNILAISGHKDTLWLATLGGATRIILDGGDPGEFKDIRSFNRDNGLVSNYIYAIYEDRQDRIWFATDGSGVSVLDQGGFSNYNEANGLTDKVIYSITGDESGNLWMATATAGVIKFDGRRFRRYGLEEGLSSLDISSLAASGDELVIINDNGLDIMYLPTESIARFSWKDGLSGISPGLNAAAVGPDGQVWIGSGRGIFRYRPSAEISQRVPLCLIEEVAVFMKPVDRVPGMSLGSRENHLSFSYTGLWYSSPESVVYQVFLEGYDLGWKSTSDRSVVYSNLRPGDYEFRVRAAADPSFRMASEAGFRFTIREPLWKSWWFVTGILLLLTGVVYFLISLRLRRLRQEARREREKIEFEFQVLKNQVNPHFLFNSFSTLMSLIEEQPDQALLYTEKLSDFFRIILQLKDREVIPVSEELELVEDYFFLLRKRFGENLELKTGLTEAHAGSSIPPMCLQMLVENAVKHNIISRDKPLLVSIYSSADRIIVENNLQPKVTAEPSTGTGLGNVIRRYLMVCGREPKISIKDGFFRVILPVI